MRTIDPGSAEWPARLGDLADPPARLWVRGEFPAAARAVAIVGARAADQAGRRRAGEIASGLARAGVIVVSGGAHGVDQAAHRGALDAGGTTIVVVAGGLDARSAIVEEALRRGAALSEQAPGTRPRAWTFLHRNRLIAALGDACVVVQADERSGALSTAAAARRLGRPVLAVPWPDLRAVARGTRGLLDRGARPAATPGDVLEVLGLPPGAEEPVSAPRRRPFEARLLELLSDRDRTVDEIAAVTGAKTQDICTALLTLELQRLVVRSHSGRFGRIR